MAEQNRGFRKFMMDPKSSVMGYLAENIPQERPSHQHGSTQPNSMSNEQHSGQGSSQNIYGHPQSANHSFASLSQSSLPQPTTNPQSFPQPYVGSNLIQPSTTYGTQTNGSASLSSRPSTPQAQILGQNPSTQAGAQQANHEPGQLYSNHQVAETSSQWLAKQGNGFPIGAASQGPPPPGTKRVSSPQSAPRLYHRMIHEFKAVKNSYYVAKSQHNTQEMATAAYELEAQSRRIWSLRVEHAWEFEGHSESSHQFIIAGWQAQYELWADTVLDVQEAQSSPGVTSPSAHGNVSINGISQQWDSQGRQDRPGYQELNGENTQGSYPTQSQQMPQLQNLSMGPGIPINPNVQSTAYTQIAPTPQPQNPSWAQSEPSQQNASNVPQPQAIPPGAFPQDGRLAPTGSTGSQSMPLQQQQQQQISQFPPTAMGQTRPPGMQNGQAIPPGPGSATQQGQGMPSRPSPSTQPIQNQPSGPNTARLPSPNMQQTQSPPPGSTVQQGQNLPLRFGPNVQQSDMQQPQHMAQGPRPNMPQPPNMSQGPPRQNPSARA